MFVYRRQVHIEFSHCDPAGIVYYPRFLQMFDDGTHGLFDAATGMNRAQRNVHYGVHFLPLIDVKASFLAPSREGEDVVIESHVAAWRRSSFDVAHKLIGGDEKLRIEARETRVWSVLTGEAHRLVSAPVPEEFKALFAR